MRTWAAKDLPARLLAAQVAKLLNCTPEDVAVLVSAGKAAAIGQAECQRGQVFQCRRTHCTVGGS
jgi:hypothetical protein